MGERAEVWVYWAHGELGMYLKEALLGEVDAEDENLKM